MKKNKTVFVAMSGGVDSSVAAALLNKRGFNVVGVFMKPYQPSAGIFNKDNCLWEQDREDALRVAAKLNIPLLTWDFSKEYEKRVAEYMIDGYRRGITPNPDVMCNKFIKFGLFLDKALKLGADYIATGHYARLRRENPNSKIQQRFRNESQAIRRNLRRAMINKFQIPKFQKNSGLKLLKARDLNKDQSYFLYTLTQKQLKYCLFPIGDWVKEEVRKMAKKFGLPNWDKKDSQGVCFVGPLKVGGFLKKYIKPQKGVVIRKSDGKILGEHDGTWFYTIGQRRGFNLTVGRPHYIIEKDIKNNILYVNDVFGNPKSKFVYSAEAASAAKVGQMTNKFQNPNSKLQIKEFNWIKKMKLPLDCKVKIRYRQKDLDCTIMRNGSTGSPQDGSDKALIKIKESNIPIAPGQAAVFYKGNEVLGGGTIV